ncbi:PREDICTED: tachykinin-like peptides receptor 99D [Wasmannia auropunctata]|uniref:tachykinin-like peptides receptor 99D n=1 Tax=Wasmannia auropunctata TaxID=64793 RepID=UPI0005EF3324|nr:PREDICTED: tachykinin-like peptides receptor 99D [Wasmannia auropunctata]
MQNLDNLTTYNSTSQFWNVTRTLWYVVDAVDVAYSNNTDYDTNNTILLPPNESLFPWWQRIIWTILFAGIIIVATSGNLIVIWIVLAHRQMRTITNYFLVNLSIADAMMSSMNVSFGYIYMFDFEWLFAGTFYCKISEFIAVLTIFVSVFTLMAISIDRYMAIIYPLKPRRGKKMTLCVAIVIWIIGIILSLPMLFYRSSDAVKFRNGVRNVCSSIWPGKTNNEHSYYENLYNVMSMILTYFLPIIFMTCTYTRVGLNLWGSQSIGEATAQQLEKIQSKRKVVKMMIVVVVMFTVCWLPIHTFFIAYYYLPEIKTKPYVYELYLIAYWLAMSNSMYNPIIYCWMNKYFRRGFVKFFFWSFYGLPSRVYHSWKS